MSDLYVNSWQLKSHRGLLNMERLGCKDLYQEAVHPSVPPDSSLKSEPPKVVGKGIGADFSPTERQNSWLLHLSTVEVGGEVGGEVLCVYTQSTRGRKTQATPPCVQVLQWFFMSCGKSWDLLCGLCPGGCILCSTVSQTTGLSLPWPLLLRL